MNQIILIMGRLVITVACVFLIVGDAHAQVFRRANTSYGKCGNSNCVMCYGQSATTITSKTNETARDNTARDTTQLNVFAPTYPLGYQQSSASASKPSSKASTPQKVVNAMLAVAQLTPNDLLYDLGCGDGRILATAWKQWGTRGVGIEIDEPTYRQAVNACRKMPIRIVYGDARKFNLHDATVVTMYLEQELMAELVPRIKNARLIISFCHPIPGYTNRRLTAGNYFIYLAEPTAVPVIPVDSNPVWKEWNPQ